MTSALLYLTEGSRIFTSSIKNRIAPKKYEGSAKEICSAIVKDCWNGTHFQASTGNFAQFWTRDFGWCVSSLLKLGYREEVHKTIRYALHRFKTNGGVTTTITPSGKPFDFPTFAIDSLPWLVHSLKLAKFNPHEYKPFLNKQIQEFFGRVINPNTGLVKPEIHFSSMKDFAIRKSSCYDNCMVGMLAKDAKELGLRHPFERYNYPDLIQRHFWNGHFFYDDLSKCRYVAGDANVFPFILGLVKDETMLQSAMKEIHAAGLDEPFPLKYTNSRKNIHFIPSEMFLRDYESTSVWMHLGPLYVKLLQQVDESRAEEYKRRYADLTELHHNFLEVFMADGQPFKTLFYYCDSGMLWAANFLTL